MKNFSILFENPEIILVNKAAGFSVQGGAGISHSLDESLSRQLGYKIHLVHRLDKETSGILIVAKSPAAAAKWTRLISCGQVQKEYAAVCFGVPLVNGKKKRAGSLLGTVEAHGRMQAAETQFAVLSECQAAIPGNENGAKLEMSLLGITIRTGRMHQIRIQMAQAQCPVAADDRHGDFKKNRLARALGIRRLHLASVKLTVPLDGRQETFSVPLPEHMARTVQQFFGSGTDA